MYKLPDGNDEIYNKYITHLTKEDILNGVDFNETLSRRLFSLTLTLGGGNIPAKELGGLEFEMDMGVDDWPIGLVTYKKMAFTVANDSAEIEDGMKTGQVVKPVIGLQALDGSNRETTLNVPYGTYVVDSVAKNMTFKNYSCYDWLYYINDIDCDFGGETYPTTVGHVLSTITGKYADKGMIPLSDSHQGDWEPWWNDVLGQPKKYKDYEAPPEEEEDDGIDIDPFEPVEDNYPQDAGQPPTKNPGKCCDCEPKKSGGGGNNSGTPGGGGATANGMNIECSAENFVFTLGQSAWIKGTIPGIEGNEDSYKITWVVEESGGKTYLINYFNFNTDYEKSFTGGDEGTVHNTTQSGQKLYLLPNAISDGTVIVTARVFKDGKLDEKINGEFRFTIKPGPVKSYPELSGWDPFVQGGGIYDSNELLESRTFKILSTASASELSLYCTDLEKHYGRIVGVSREGIKIPVDLINDDKNLVNSASYVSVKVSKIYSSNFKNSLMGYILKGKFSQGKFYWVASGYETSSLPTDVNHSAYIPLSDSGSGKIQTFTATKNTVNYNFNYIDVDNEIFFPNFYRKNAANSQTLFPIMPVDTTEIYLRIDNINNTSIDFSDASDTMSNQYGNSRYVLADVEVKFYGTANKGFDSSTDGNESEPTSYSLMRMPRTVSAPSYNDNGDLIVTYAEEPDPNDPAQTPNENGQVLVTTPEEIGFEMTEGQMLGYIAAYCGGNVAMDHEGEVRLLRLTDDISDEGVGYDKHIPNSQVAIPEIDNCEASSTLGGLIIHTSTYEGDDIKLGNEKPSQTHYVLEIDNPFLTEERASEIFEEMSSLTYFPMRVVILSDPRLWLGDLLYFDGYSQLNEASGVNVEVVREGYYPIMKLLSHYDGAPSLQIEANCSNLSDRSNSFTGTLNDKIDEVSAKVDETNKSVNEMKYEIEEIRALVGYFNELFAIEVNADNIVSATINTKNIRIAPVKGKDNGGLFIDGDSIDFIDNDGVQRLHIGSSGDDKDYYIRFLNANGYTRDLRALDPGPCCCDGDNNDDNDNNPTPPDDNNPTPPDDGDGDDTPTEGVDKPRIELQLDGMTDNTENNPNNWHNKYDLTVNGTQTFDVKCRLVDKPKKDTIIYGITNFTDNSGFIAGSSTEKNIEISFTPDNYNEWQTIPIIVDGNKYSSIHFRFATVNNETLLGGENYATILMKINK